MLNPKQFGSWMDAPAKKNSWTAIAGETQSRKQALAGRVIGAAYAATAVGLVGGLGGGTYAVMKHDLNSPDHSSVVHNQGPGSGNPVWAPKPPPRLNP
jgi:hypothetical protein